MPPTLTLICHVALAQWVLQYIVFSWYLWLKLSMDNVPGRALYYSPVVNIVKLQLHVQLSFIKCPTLVLLPDTVKFCLFAPTAYEQFRPQASFSDWHPLVPGGKKIDTANCWRLVSNSLEKNWSKQTGCAGYSPYPALPIQHNSESPQLHPGGLSRLWNWLYLSFFRYVAQAKSTTHPQDTLFMQLWFRLFPNF